MHLGIDYKKLIELLKTNKQKTITIFFVRSCELEQEDLSWKVG